MTLDEAIKHAEEVAEIQGKYCPTPEGVVDNHKKCAEEHRQIAEWLKDYNRLLEQELCEDCINREQAIKQCGFGMTSLLIADSLRRLPPVTPQPKMGRWIEEIDDYGEVIGWHCDKCYEDSGFTTDCKWDYCPNCGAKMQEVEENGQISNI